MDIKNYITKEVIEDLRNGNEPEISGGGTYW